VSAPGYVGPVAITSEQIWAASEISAEHEADRFVFGQPARRPTEASRLLYGVDWAGVARAATAGFFDERDPTRPIRSTLAKLVGVITVLAGITLITLGMLTMLCVWTIRAAFG
jgi:hypothetical protein